MTGPAILDVRPPAAPGGEAPLLQIVELSKRFPVGSFWRPKELHALANVSFAIQRGQAVALVGESGSGKSTIAKIVARLLAPTSGRILFEGMDIVAAEPRRASLAYRRKVQMIFQDPFGSLNPVHTIGHHLRRPLEIHGLAHDRRSAQERVLSLLTAVGLNPAEEFAGKHPHQLSGGQRQRVAISRALAVDPILILADEPISMLDVSVRMGILNILEQLKEERSISFLYITHDIASARYFADQIVVLYAGHLVESAPSEILIAEPAHPYTQLLLAAVPNPHAGLTTHSIQARGEVPTRIDPPPGCPFAARCPQVMAVCREATPPLLTIAQDHTVACHLYDSQSVHNVQSAQDARQ